MNRNIRSLSLGIGIAVAGTAAAQYKSIGPDGRVTYSDVAPPAGARVVEQKKPNGAGTSTVPLPFELQQVATKYPVTLYTGDRCAPCEQARNYLRARGVPFVEKTVTSDDDIALFKRQSPDGTAPVIAVGGRRSVGFSQVAWAGLLDNAGYPAVAALPRDYQNPAPTPLSPTTRASAQDLTRPDAPATKTARPAPAPASLPPVDNGSGFRF